MERHKKSIIEKEREKLEGLFWISIGFFICILAWKIDIGSFVEPGSGFVAFISGFFIFSIGLVMIISKTFLKSPHQSRSDVGLPFQRASWLRLIYTLGLLFGYILLFDTLGYILSTFLLLGSMSYDLEKKNWASSLLFSLITVIISYLMFEVWLRCQLPRGIFPWW